MKDTPDRPDESLPIRRSMVPPVSAPPLVDGYDDYVDPAPHGGSGKRVSFRLVSRAIRRFWWQAFILWIAGSAGLVALAYYKIKPTYDAIAQVSVEQNLMSNILAPVAKEMDLSQFMKTQVAKITSPPILNAALVDNPKLNASPMLAGSEDKEADIRSALRVGIVPGSNLIQIEMPSPIPAEAAEMVNAVVNAYIDNAKVTSDDATKRPATASAATMARDIRSTWNSGWAWASTPFTTTSSTPSSRSQPSARWAWRSRSSPVWSWSRSWNSPVRAHVSSSSPKWRPSLRITPSTLTRCR